MTKLDEEKEAQAAKVEEAVVYYPCKFCQNGVDIVDTPGLNDDERMTRITEEIIPKLDVVIMVLVPDNPFSISEADFVLNKLMTSDLGRLLFLVNKIDTVRPASDGKPRWKISRRGSRKRCWKASSGNTGRIPRNTRTRRASWEISRSIRFPPWTPWRGSWTGIRS